MEENEEYADGADVFHEEKINVEQPSIAQRSPVSEFGTHNLMRHKPTDEDTREEAHNRQEELAGDKIEKIEEGLTEERKMFAYT